MKRVLILCGLLSCLLIGSAEAVFDFSMEKEPDQIWVGSEMWANRLQDWQITAGEIECKPDRNLPMRTLHLLSHDLNATGSAFQMSVDLGWKEPAKDGAAGFLLGAGNGEMDYRGAALIHQTPGLGAGLFVGIDAFGRVFIHDNETGLYIESNPLVRDEQKKQGFKGRAVTLSCSAKKGAGKTWEIKVQAHDPTNGKLIGQVSGTVPARRLIGNVGLVADPGEHKKAKAYFWFNHWKGSGDRLAIHPDRRLGPVVGTHYTVSRKILKMSAQMMPLPVSRLGDATLEIQVNGTWKTVATVKVDSEAYVAVFRIENWDDSQKVSYRVTAPHMRKGEHPWVGTIQKNPRTKENFVVAAFTGNHNLSRSVSAGGRYQKGHKGDWIHGTWFPHDDLVANVEKQNPDLLFFSGDQVYESASPSFPDGQALRLDYLYKWYIYMWAFRDMTANLPTVCIPDDHDVYQGNFWGQGGRWAKRQNDGGYVKPADFVKMVERTQTTNLPDPVDPRPVEQGIGVYFTALNWGAVSFAILEDRKFKTGPDSEEAKSGDLDRLVLLGDRQINFINQWAGDWSDGAAMKSSLTATIFAQLHTWRTKDGGIEQDPDTNGWPVKGRNRALRALRKGFTLMIGGDQHLATTAHHGIDEYGDAGWSICVPSIANYFPRSWKPLVKGKNRLPNMPDYTGDFLDSWGNKITMYAVANPGIKSGHKPAALHDRVPGYGIICFDQKTRKIEMTNWPRYATKGNGKPYPGWPITILQASNYGRKVTAWLPEIEVTGMENPVIKIYEKETNKLVYALRIQGRNFQPGVFKTGDYLVKVGDPDTHQWVTYTLRALTHKGQEKLIVANFVK